MKIKKRIKCGWCGRRRVETAYIRGHSVSKLFDTEDYAVEIQVSVTDKYVPIRRVCRACMEVALLEMGQVLKC